MDFFVNFNTGFYEKGSLVKSRSKIVKNYILHGTFFMDLITYFAIFILPGKLVLLYLYKIFKIQ